MVSNCFFVQFKKLYVFLVLDSATLPPPLRWRSRSSFSPPYRHYRGEGGEEGSRSGGHSTLSLSLSICHRFVGSERMTPNKVEIVSRTVRNWALIKACPTLIVMELIASQPIIFHRLVFR